MLSKFLKNTFFVLVSNIASKVLGFFTIAFLARNLTPADLGYFNAIQNSASSLNLMSFLGVPIVIQRASARLNELGSRFLGAIFGYSIVIVLIASVVLSTGFYIGRDYFFNVLLQNGGGLDLFLLIIPTLIFLNLSSVPMYFIMGLNQFKLYSQRNILANVIIFVCTFLTIQFFTGSKAHAAIIGSLLALIINTTYTWWLVLKLCKQFSVPINLSEPKKTITYIFKEGFIYYVGNVLFTALSNFFVISLFSKHLTIEDYGYLRIATSLSTIFAVIPAAIQPVTISMLADGNSDSATIKSVQIRILSAVTILASIFILANLNWIISFLFGGQYLAGNTIYICQMLLQFLIILHALLANFLTAEGFANYVGKMNALNVVLFTISAILLMPQYKIFGYFISFFIGTFVSFLFFFYKEFKQGSNYKDKSRLFTLISTLLILSLVVPYFLNLIQFHWIIMNFIILSLSLLVFYFVLNTDEILKIKILLKKKPVEEAK